MAGSIVFLYDWADASRRDNDENIFTPLNLQIMCQIEHLVIDDEKYSDYCQVCYLN